MQALNWTYDFDPEFPMYVFPYTVQGNKDRLHWHDYYEIGLCTRGHGRFLYVNKEYTVGEGDVFLTNNFENHVAITDDGAKAEYIFCIFMPLFVADPGGRQFDLEYLFPFHYNPLNFENRVKAGSPAAEKIGGILTSMLELYQCGRPFRKMQLDIKLRELLLEFSRHYSAQLNPGGHSGVNPMVQKAIQYMNLHFSEPITLELMAGMLEISPSYFRHLFKESTRVSFKQYVTQLRMAQAKKLLLSTDKPVSEIIEDVGYNNYTQFYRTFQRFTFMTPAEYRKEYRKLYPMPEPEG